MLIVHLNKYTHRQESKARDTITTSKESLKIHELITSRFNSKMFQ